MKTMNFLTSKVLMSIFVTATVMFTSCSDDILTNEGASNQAPEGADTALLEAYGLSFQNFITDNDVQILNADTTQLAVSKALADKLGITTFVGHPLGIWQDMSQLPFARKATAEELVGDIYVLTVQPASVAEIIGNKKVTLNTSLYVNNDTRGAAMTRAVGIDVPDYAAKYMDEDNVIHPAVIQMTGDYDYEQGYRTDDDQPKAITRSAGDGYQYMTADELMSRQTRASVHRRILSFHDELEIDKNFQCGENEEDSINVNFVAPLDFELNYFITLDGGVKWHVFIPEPYVERFEAGIDGKFAFSPELKIGFKKEWKLDEDKWKKKLASFNGYTFTFWLGPVPVSIKCEPALFMKIDGKVTGQVYMGLKYEYENNFRGGIRYTDSNGWSTISEFEEVKNELTFIRPEAQVKAEAGIGIYLGMDVMIYDVAGPEVAVGPRLGAEAELTVSPFADSFDETLNFRAEVGLTMNAVVGAKLQVLGYELAEYTKTIHLAGPWTLWKYPSDGSEHIAGETEDQRLFNMYEVNWLKESLGYYKVRKIAIDELMEIRGISEKEAREVIRALVIDYLISKYGQMVNNVSCACQCVSDYILGDLQKEYDEYEYQKHAAAGDMEWINAKNWENICLMLDRNYDVKNKRGVFDEIHQLFVKTFKREPNATSEDLSWLADHIINSTEYAKEEYAKALEDLHTIQANIQSRYASYKAEYPKYFDSVLDNLDYEYRVKYDCAPTPNDNRVYQLFESMVQELIAKEKARAENAKNCDWNYVSEVLKGELSDYFNYNARYSQRILKSSRTWFQECYHREPSASQADIDIMTAHFKETIKTVYNVEL